MARIKIEDLPVDEPSEEEVLGYTLNEVTYLQSVIPPPQWVSALLSPPRIPIPGGFPDVVASVRGLA